MSCLTKIRNLYVFHKVNRKFATEDYKDEGLIWIGGYYCKFEKGFEVGMKDHRGYFEITKVEI